MQFLHRFNLYNAFYLVNLVPFGPEVGDQKVHPGMLTAGQTIDLHMYFPYYGGLYNYSTVSNGKIFFSKNDLKWKIFKTKHAIYP